MKFPFDIKHNLVKMAQNISIIDLTDSYTEENVCDQSVIFVGESFGPSRVPLGPIQQSTITGKGAPPTKQKSQKRHSAQVQGSK